MVEGEKIQKIWDKRSEVRRINPEGQLGGLLRVLLSQKKENEKQNIIKQNILQVNKGHISSNHKTA